jgi:hypothetical protein
LPKIINSWTRGKKGKKKASLVNDKEMYRLFYMILKKTNC